MELDIVKEQVEIFAAGLELVEGLQTRIEFEENDDGEYSDFTIYTMTNVKMGLLSNVTTLPLYVFALKEDSVGISVWDDRKVTIYEIAEACSIDELHSLFNKHRSEGLKVLRP